MVMLMVSVDDVVDGGFAADPPPIGDSVRPLKISHSPSTPTRNAAAPSFCRDLTDIQDHNDLPRVATDEPDAGALLTAADDGAVASPVGDVVHAPNAKHNPTVTARRAAARS